LHTGINTREADALGPSAFLRAVLLVVNVAILDLTAAITPRAALRGRLLAVEVKASSDNRDAKRGHDACHQSCFRTGARALRKLRPLRPWCTLVAWLTRLALVISLLALLRRIASLLRRIAALTLGTLEVLLRRAALRTLLEILLSLLHLTLLLKATLLLATLLPAALLLATLLEAALLLEAPLLLLLETTLLLLVPALILERRC